MLTVQSVLAIFVLTVKSAFDNLECACFLVPWYDFYSITNENYVTDLKVTITLMIIITISVEGYIHQEDELWVITLHSYTSMHACTPTKMHVCKYTQTHLYTHIQVHTQVHTHTSPHSGTHTHRSDQSR